MFDGWNTKRDGSGQKFKNEDDFINIQNRLNLGNNDDGEVIVLYAQWKPAYSTLIIDPNGGSYNGETTITQRFRTVYSLDPNKLTPPAGPIVTYDTQGGNKIEPTHTTTHFRDGHLLIHYMVYLFLRQIAMLLDCMMLIMFFQK